MGRIHFILSVTPGITISPAGPLVVAIEAEESGRVTSVKVLVSPDGSGRVRGGLSREFTIGTGLRMDLREAGEAGGNPGQTDLSRILFPLAAIPS